MRENVKHVDTQNQHHDRIWITDISGLILKIKQNKKTDVQLKFCLYSLNIGRRRKTIFNSYLKNIFNLTCNNWIILMANMNLVTAQKTL